MLYNVSIVCIHVFSHLYGVDIVFFFFFVFASRVCLYHLNCLYQIVRI